MSYFSTHNHSSYSNVKAGLDSINRIDEMIKYANEIGLSGICLSDHEILSGHVSFIQEYKKLKEDGTLKDGFKVGLANEIYLVSEDSLEELKENQSPRKEDSQFFHFLLISLNPNGYLQLKKLSSLAWENSWKAGLVERTPTFKKNLKSIIEKGDVVASTACLGGEASQMLLRIKRYTEEGNIERVGYYKKKLNDFIEFCIDVFGKEHFYLEIQPSNNEEQVYVNRELIKLSKETGLKYTIATDGHYLKKEDRGIHKTYLLSQNMEREVDAFYDATYIMSESEIREYLHYLSEEEIQAGFDATMDIYDKVELFDLAQDTIVPMPPIPEFEFQHTLEQGYDTYEYIKKFAMSENEIDRYFLHLIQEGLVDKIVRKRKSDKEYFHICLERINTELKEIWLISEKLHQRLSAYYVLVRDVVVNVMWEAGDSVVGVSRGSGAGFLVNFLIDITQLNSLDYNLPHFRHLTAERPELPDIDIDTEQSKRGQILEGMKERYGRSRVLNIATFTREGSRSALLSAARGMGIDIDEVNFLTSLIPVERGFTWTLKKCFFGGDGEKPVRELLNAVSKYDGLIQNSIKIEGLIKSKSVHASGIYVFNKNYVTQNAMMKSNSGKETTQFDMSDSDYMGALKIDALTVEGMDRIRTAMDLLTEYGFIEDKGSLKATYEAYLHPDNLVYENEEMWDKVANNEIPDLFQFETPVGGQCVRKSKPKSIPELSAANSLMRLMADGEEQPIDKFVRHKENINDWYKEMDEYGLTSEEVKILEKHLLPVYGVSSSQEEMMLLLMDEDICGFNIIDSNKARKVVGKKLMSEIPKIKDMVFTQGVASQNLRQYIWDTQIVPQLGYSFSNIHSSGYSLIALQEMNLAHFYPRIFWDVACLTVSAGADEDNENNKSTKYGKVASGISKMKSHSVNVVLPLINHAGFGFTPDVENNRIIFGLKGIVGINDELVHEIIRQRPFATFDDFYSRMYEGKLIQKGQFVHLIKAGCFNEFNNQPNIMKQFIFREVDVKDKLNGQNLSRIISLGLLDTPELKQYQDYFNFRKHIMKKVHETTDKPKDKIYILDDYSQVFFENNFSSDSVVGEFNSKLLVSDKLFKKEYDNKMLPISDLYTDEAFLKRFNQAQFIELWEQLAGNGTVSKWQMESVSFYADAGHELAHVDNERYGIVDFFSLPEEAIVAERYEWKGKQMERYQLFNISGVCLERNKNNHTITLLTENGVVTVKTHAGSFAFYDKRISKLENGKKTVLEGSWLSRGSLLMLTGYRRQNQFLLKAPKGQHTINKILEVRSDGTLSLQSERARV